jgi:hypothetical protein
MAIYVEVEPDALWVSLCDRLDVTLAWPPNVAALLEA